MITPLVTLIIGVITSIIASVTLIAGKENKISEFRQAWVDAQRSDLATATAAAYTYHSYNDPDKRAACKAEFMSSATRVSLREKPDGREWIEVLTSLSALQSMIESGNFDSTIFTNAAQVISTKSRVPLKRHWITVKKGEKGYVTFKNAFIGALAAICIIILAIVTWGAFQSPQIVKKLPLTGSPAEGRTLNRPSGPSKSSTSISGSRTSVVNTPVSNKS